jgi:hypothetical protein
VAAGVYVPHRVDEASAVCCTRDRDPSPRHRDPGNARATHSPGSGSATTPATCSDHPRYFPTPPPRCPSTVRGVPGPKPATQVWAADRGKPRRNPGDHQERREPQITDRVRRKNCSSARVFPPPHVRRVARRSNVRPGSHASNAKAVEPTAPRGRAATADVVDSELNNEDNG